MKPRLVLPLAIVLVLLLVVPASAEPPVIVTGEAVEDFPPYVPSPCPGFEVWDREVYTFRQTSFFDNDGNLLRIETHYIGTDNFYNPANPGVELSGHFSGTLEYDARTGEMTARGLAVNITVPGYGVVLMRSGLWASFPNPDIHVAGKDSLEDPKDMEQFCSLLAGD